MNISILNTKGKETGKKANLDDAIYGVKPNDHAIYLDVKRVRAGQHRGTHKAKTRAEVKGSTRKIKRQKGSGTARAGAITSPLFKGGGRVFGPVPRSYNISLTKKVKSLARRSALTYKAQDKEIIILEDFAFDSPKTKEWVSILHNLKLSGRKSLLVLNEDNRNLYLSIRNIPECKVINVNELNTYNILDSGTLVLVESALEKIESTLKTLPAKEMDESKKSVARPVKTKATGRRAKKKIAVAKLMEKIDELPPPEEKKKPVKGKKDKNQEKGIKEQGAQEAEGKGKDKGAGNEDKGKGGKGPKENGSGDKPDEDDINRPLQDSDKQNANANEDKGKEVQGDKSKEGGSKDENADKDKNEKE